MGATADRRESKLAAGPALLASPHIHEFFFAVFAASLYLCLASTVFAASLYLCLASTVFAASLPSG